MKRKTKRWINETMEILKLKVLLLILRIRNLSFSKNHQSLTPDITAALDRASISDRDETYIIAACRKQAMELNTTIHLGAS